MTLWWQQSPQFTRALAIASAIAIGLYVACGPSARPALKHKRNKRKRHFPPGLANVGNNCFVNAVLQSLAPCTEFKAWLEDSSPTDEAKEEGEEENLGVGKALLKCLKALNNQGLNLHELSPQELLDSLRSHGWYIDTQEQDSHEFLHILLTSVEEEIQKREEATFQQERSITDVLQSDLTQALESLKVDEDRGVSVSPSLPNFGEAEKDEAPKHQRRSSGVFSRSAGGEISVEQVKSQTSTLKRKKKASTPFSGTLTNKVSFSDGRAKSPLSSSSFNNITLNLPAPNSAPFNPLSGGAVTLETLLQMYISREAVEAEVKVDGERDKIVKQLTFGRLPRCLCLHIQRTAFTNGYPSKRGEHVRFPELLDMSRYVYLNQLKKDSALKAVVAGSNPGQGERSNEDQKVKSGMTFRLKSVVVHLGAINSGHYVTYRRGPEGGQNYESWFLTSDSVVEEAPFTQVLKSHAYMLFYEKVME